MTPTRIAISPKFAPQLARELSIPHALALLPDEGDAEIARILAGSDVLVGGTFKPTWQNANGSALRLVHVVGAGLDGIAFASLPPTCRVCNVFGHERGVTEQAFLLILALHKKLFALDRALRNGDWNWETACLPEIRGRNLLILGYGHIGQELARWGYFFGLNVTALTRTPGKERNTDVTPAYLGHLSELEAHLPDADFVVIAIPATAATADRIHERQFNLMKRTAFIINVGRAAVINESALYAALRDRRIGGAGLDVWYKYPVLGQRGMPSHEPFHTLDNVIMTPHKPSIETMEFRWREIAKNIARLAMGEPLVNQVWPRPAGSPA